MPEYENIMNRVAILPNEIQYKIMSYSNNIQSPRLCEDIRNYYMTLVNIYQQYYSIYIEGLLEQDPGDKEWLINDIYSYMNDYYPTCLGYREQFCNIIKRSYILLCHKKVGMDINKYIQSLNSCRVDSEINIIWGLLTIEERNHFINYSIRDIDLIGENLFIAEEAEPEEDYDY